MGTPPHGAQHQMRRGTFTNISTFIGAQGEALVDSFYWRMNMEDGVVPGGYPHELALVQTVTSSVATVSNSVAVCLVFSTNAAATITLPSAASYAPGQQLIVADAAGAASANNITINQASTDSIWSSTGGAVTSVTISVNGRWAKFMSNSSGHWMLSSAST